MTLTLRVSCFKLVYKPKGRHCHPPGLGVTKTTVSPRHNSRYSERERETLNTPSPVLDLKVPPPSNTLVLLLAFMTSMVWELCPHCGMPLNGEENIRRLRIVIIGAGFGGVCCGAALLPALGFGLGGITAGSFAAGIQGPAVVAGSLFATLQSLGATGMGILLFGSMGGAIGVLAPLATQLGWCNGNCNHHQK
jgi:Interferon-induced 6-16 family